MKQKKFLSLTKTKVRLLYWAFVILLMIFVVCPVFLFFYLFNEAQVRQMLYSQFDNKNYHVQVNGKITPHFWHGLSIEVNDAYVFTNKNVELFSVKVTHCQLSWLDLVMGHYKIKRIALNNVDIYEKNITDFGLDNLLNGAKLDQSPFSKLKHLSMYRINSVDESASYPITDGVLRIDQIRGVAKFKFGFKLSDKDIFVVSEGDMKKISDNIVKFNNFTTKIYNKNTHIQLIADTSYHILEKQLMLQNVAGDLSWDDYTGKIKADKINLSFAKAEANNIKFELNLNNAFANQSVNLSLDQVKSPHYNTLYINNMNVNYLMGIQLNKVVLDSKLSNVKITSSDITSNTCNGSLSYSPPTTDNNTFNALLSGVCEYHFNNRQLNLNMTGSLDKAPIQLALKVSNNKDKPNITVSGVMDELNLSPFEVNKDKLMPFYYDTSGLPFSWLSSFNMDGNLVIKRFMLDRIHLNDVSTSFNLSNNILNINKLEADVYNGTLSGSAKIAKLPTGYSISTVENFHNLDLKEMFTDLFDVEAISGKADLQIDASTSKVNSYEDLHKHLNGKILVNASHGAFQGVDFNLFAAPKLGIDTNKSTIFEQLSARLDFVNGISSNGSLNFNSPYLIAGGSGTVDFVNTLLDYVLTIKSALPPNKQKINSVVIPVAAKGDLFNPKISIQNIHLFTGQLHVLREQTPIKRSLKKTKLITKTKSEKASNKLHKHDSVKEVKASAISKTRLKIERNEHLQIHTTNSNRAHVAHIAKQRKSAVDDSQEEVLDLIPPDTPVGAGAAIDDDKNNSKPSSAEN